MRTMEAKSAITALALRVLEAYMLARVRSRKMINASWQEESRAYNYVEGMVGKNKLY
jgi:hypothetical protein